MQLALQTEDGETLQRACARYHERACIMVVAARIRLKPYAKATQMLHRPVALPNVRLASED